jgi:hypothetical protein
MSCKVVCSWCTQCLGKEASAICIGLANRHCSDSLQICCSEARPRQRAAPNSSGWAPTGPCGGSSSSWGLQWDPAAQHCWLQALLRRQRGLRWRWLLQLHCCGLCCRSRPLHAHGARCCSWTRCSGVTLGGAARRGACCLLASSCCAQARVASRCRHLPAGCRWRPKADDTLVATTGICAVPAVGAGAAPETRCGWAAAAGRICWWGTTYAAGAAGRT